MKIATCKASRLIGRYLFLPKIHVVQAEVRLPQLRHHLQRYRLEEMYLYKPKKMHYIKGYSKHLSPVKRFLPS